MKTLALWIFLIVWFLHLIVGAGAGFAALRLWNQRADKFARRLLIALHAPMIYSLTAIVLVISPMPQGVVLTWKFGTVWVVGTLLMDLVWLPLLTTLIKGFKEQDDGE